MMMKMFVMTTTTLIIIIYLFHHVKTTALATQPPLIIVGRGGGRGGGGLWHHHKICRRPVEHHPMSLFNKRGSTTTTVLHMLFQRGGSSGRSSGDDEDDKTTASSSSSFVSMFPFRTRRGLLQAAAQCDNHVVSFPNATLSSSSPPISSSSSTSTSSSVSNVDDNNDDEMRRRMVITSPTGGGINITDAIDIPSTTTTTASTTTAAASAATTVTTTTMIPDVKGGDDDASLVGDDDSSIISPLPPPQPTLTQLRRFALPCLALWISGPLLSLVDTATVGLSAAPGTGAAQLGALGPATTFIDGATYLFAFLNVATTNLYAAAIARYRQGIVTVQEHKKSRGRGTKAEEQQQHDVMLMERGERLAGDGVVRTSVQTSLFCGFFLMFLLLSRAGQAILRVYVGRGQDDNAAKILTPAYQYIQIRALSMPTSLLGGVLQAALLGARDSVTPLISIAYSTVINVVGDILCVKVWHMGIVGASLATLVAQWAGTAAMIGPARRKLFARREDATQHDDLVVDGVSSSSSIPSDSNKVSIRSFLAFALPVLTLILGKMAAFGVMTHVAAALPSPSALAAHQITLSLFFFVSPFLEVISQTAQAFLPQYFVDTSSTSTSRRQEWEEQAMILSTRLLRIGIIVAMIMAIVSGSIPRYFPWALTNDAAVQSSVRPLGVPLALGTILTAPVAVSEGVLLARRDLPYLASVYVLSTALLPVILFRVKRFHGPVDHVWTCFAGFQLFRACCFTGRLWWRGSTKKRTTKETQKKMEMTKGASSPPLMNAAS